MLGSVPNDKQIRRDDRARGIAVLIADPNPATRSALRIALKDAETVTVVGEVPDLPSAISAVSAAQVDIVLAASGVAGLRSESARAGLAQLSRRVPVIVMGMGDPRFYAAPLRAAGAAGYWPKDGDLAQLTGLVVAAAH
jgi:DNA-binding NarL/FixJ family response regulator